MGAVRRIGPQMRYLASRVIEGDSICSLVDRAYTTRHGHRSRTFGYRAVHRAIRAGLIKVRSDDSARYYLIPVPENKTIADLTTEEMRTMLASILGDLDGKEWSADSLDSIAQTFRLFGVPVADVDRSDG